MDGSDAVRWQDAWLVLHPSCLVFIGEWSILLKRTMVYGTYIHTLSFVYFLKINYCKLNVGLASTVVVGSVIRAQSEVEMFCFS